MLAAFKYDFDWAVRGVVVLTSGLLSWYVFSVFLPTAPSVVLAAGVAVALLAYPEWYVIDTAGVLMGAGAAALFGISFGVLPAVVLLLALAVYDAISVYGTRHMLELAEGVMDLRIPVVLVVPTSLSYSLLDADMTGVADAEGADEGDAATADGGSPGGGSAGSESATTPAGGDDAVAGDGGDAAGNTDDTGDTDGVGDGEEVGDVEDDDRPDGNGDDDSVRDAFFIGLGDAVMPTVMVASGAFFSPAASLGLSTLPALNLPALTAMVGTFVGFFLLMWAVTKGRAHAGLPLLNGGAVGGYLVGSLVVGVTPVEALGLAPYL
jgi:presenilin-like A22 family membrane protease